MGCVTYVGSSDTAAAATLAASLDPLAAPAPSTVNGAEPRGPGRRRADALVELARRALAAGRLPVSGRMCVRRWWSPST